MKLFFRKRNNTTLKNFILKYFYEKCLIFGVENKW